MRFSRFGRRRNSLRSPSRNDDDLQAINPNRPGHDDDDDEKQSMDAATAGAADPNGILTTCQSLDFALDHVDAQLSQLAGLHEAALSDPSLLHADRRIDALHADVMAACRGLVDRARRLKALPASAEPRNASQVRRVDHRLAATMGRFREMEARLRERLLEAHGRQYRIVNPDATDEEVARAAARDGAQAGGGVFTQALLRGDRRGHMQSTLRAVGERHEAVQRIERDMVEMTRLFLDLNEMVVADEPAVVKIEDNSMAMEADVAKGNDEIDEAMRNARSRRRKKWYLLGVCVLIIVVGAIIIAVLVA